MIPIDLIADGVPEGIEDVIITIIDQSDCEDNPIMVSFSIQDELSLDACCDATINVGECVDLSVTGGNTYVWSPDDGSLDDITSANPVACPNQTTTYTVTSPLGGCDLIGQVTVVVGGCDSDAGTVSLNSPICAGSSVQAAASGQIMEANDALAYALHNNPDGNIGAADFELYGISSNGSFLNDGSAPTNTVIYVSSAVGDDDGTGLPSLGDPCLSVSPGAAVVFLDPVEVVPDEICDTEIGEFSVQISATGGYPAYDASQSYTVSGDGLASISLQAGEQTLIVLGAFDGQTYSYTATDALGCTSTYVSPLVNCIKLAVELLEFRGEVMEDHNLLSWTTASEIDNNYFIVERSFDGNQFEGIGQIDGAGNSTEEIDYIFKDLQVQDGAHFYRLKQVDFDGASSYSDVVLLNRTREEAVGQFGIAPVPANDEIWVSFDQKTSGTSTLRLIDVTGKTIATQSLDGIEAGQKVRMDLTELSTGLYFVSWDTPTGSEVLRFIKE